MPPLGKTDLFLEQDGNANLRTGRLADEPESEASGISNVQIGLIAIVLTFIGFYLAFTKSIPFAGHGYQLKAVFADAQNIRAKSPVRISGVDVGEVSDVQHVTDANGEGRGRRGGHHGPQGQRRCRSARTRPSSCGRGSSSRATCSSTCIRAARARLSCDSGSVVPENQTSSSVQFDQVLTSLQAPVRQDLQIFLKEFGGALDKYGGAKGFQETFRTSPAAYRVHVAGEPGAARHPARRPGRVRLEPRCRRPRAEREQQRPAGPDHQPQHGQRRTSPPTRRRCATRSSSCRRRSPSAGRRSSSSTRTSRRSGPSRARPCRA